MVAQIKPQERPGPARLADLIVAVGTARFSACLFDLLRLCCRADFCAMYVFDTRRARCMGAVGRRGIEAGQPQALQYVSDPFWGRDPSLRAQPGFVVRMRPEQLADHEFRDAIYRPNDIADRLMVWQLAGGLRYGISALRTTRHGYFSEAESAGFGHLAPELAAALATHDRLGAPGAGAALLTSLPLIEARLTACSVPLSRREVQVCGRILYGLSTAGIAVDLEIAEDSVATYRKRAYAKLCIGVERELLLWYLGL